MLPKTIPMIIFFVDQNQKNLALSQILDIEKLKNVEKPIDKANGVSTSSSISQMDTMSPYSDLM